MFRKNFYLGFLGCIGFFALRYVTSHNLYDLAYLGFFAFFSNFFIGKIQGTRTDERFQENQKIAFAQIGKIAILMQFAIWCIALLTGKLEWVFVLSVIGYVALTNFYAIRLYWLEEK